MKSSSSHNVIAFHHLLFFSIRESVNTTTPWLPPKPLHIRSGYMPFRLPIYSRTPYLCDTGFIAQNQGTPVLRPDDTVIITQ